MSPVIVIVALGQGIHDLEASSEACVMGEYVATCRGLSPWQVIQRITSELGRAMPFPSGSLQQAEEARRRYGGVAVGPTHSRGVVGVIPGEPRVQNGESRDFWCGTLEGVGGKA